MSFHDNTDPSTCPTSKELQHCLHKFDSKIKAHCGVPKNHVSLKDQLEDEQGLSKKIEKLAKLVVAFRTGTKTKTTRESRVVRLQEVIKQTLIKWSREGIKDGQLMEKVFLLLHRQFNESEEVVKALASTYVVEKVSDFSDGIIEFRDSLGHLRNLLNIGMGEEEEQLLESKLK